jgi:hypothetical protein
MKKEVVGSFAFWEFNFSPKNVSLFRRDSKNTVNATANCSTLSGCKKEWGGFLHFCGTHGLTLEGRIFILWFRLKGWVRRAIRFVAK